MKSSPYARDREGQAFFRENKTCKLSVGDYVELEWTFYNNRRYYGIVSEIFIRFLDYSSISYFKIYVIYSDSPPDNKIKESVLVLGNPDELGIFPHEFKLISHIAASSL